MINTAAQYWNTERVKIVVVGDGGVGKTALLCSFTTNTFEEDYLPTVFENFTAGINFKGRYLTLSIWDTAGQEEYSRLRALSYPDTNIFFLCFDVTKKHSFTNVRDRWYTEIMHHCPDAKLLLIGTKSDLRDSRSVTEPAAKVMASFLNTKYCECSAKTQQGLQAVFETGLQMIMEQTPKEENNTCKKRKCLLL